jgi:hypothetical protein
LWVYGGARLDVLWKGNMTFLWILVNDFFMIAGDSDFEFTVRLAVLERLSPYLSMLIKNV